jgi:hypothetical protein
MLDQRYRLLGTERTYDPTISPERRETLRKAEEALKRAQHWAEWMDNLETDNSRRDENSPMNSKGTRFPLRSGRSGLRPSFYTT